MRLRGGVAKPRIETGDKTTRRSGTVLWKGSSLGEYVNFMTDVNFEKPSLSQ